MFVSPLIRVSKYIIIDKLTKPNGTEIEIFKIEKPSINYILLEAIKIGDSQNANSVMMIALDKKADLKIVYDL